MKKIEREKGRAVNDDSVLGQLTGVTEVRRMCEGLDKEFRDFVTSMGGRPATRPEPTSGLSVEGVGDICRHMWNQKAQELELHIRREVAKELRDLVSKGELGATLEGFVPWESFTNGTGVLASRCRRIEEYLKAWDAGEVDPP